MELDNLTDRLHYQPESCPAEKYVQECIHAVLPNLCTFPSHDGLKWDIFQCKNNNSKSIGSVVFFT